MHPKLLFLERCDQAAILADSPKEIDMLTLAGILRQLLADRHSLVDTVNTYSPPLRFRAVKLTPIWEIIPSMKRETMVLHAQNDGIDPEIYPPNGMFETLELTLGEFLNHVVAYTRTKDLTVKDVIRYAANAAGGIHHDPNPRAEYAVQAEYAAKIIIGGLPFGIHQLRSVARVALRGLDPLVAAIRKEMEQP